MTDRADAGRGAARLRWAVEVWDGAAGAERWTAWGFYRTRRGAAQAAARAHSQRDYRARVIDREAPKADMEVRRYGD